MDLIVKNLYGCFKNSILTDKSVTNFIHQQKGNCFKPLTFSLVIDTFTLSIKQEQYNRFGYKIVKYLTPRQRYQFADFVVYMARLKSENKILLNVFSRCCAWAKAIISEEICHCFGLRILSSENVRLIFQDFRFLCLQNYPSINKNLKNMRSNSVVVQCI